MVLIPNLLHPRRTSDLIPVGGGQRDPKIQQGTRLAGTEDLPMPRPANRCGEPDFGHFMLNYEDRIQSRIQEIWGVELFPNRVNVSEFEPVDFVAVGVGPLSHDTDFVQEGEAAECLLNDAYFMATKMGVVYPPLPPLTEREFGMIKAFCSNNPQPNEEDIRNLCKTFKARANGKDIFPKLPSMIKPAIKRWKINQAMALLKLQAGESYDVLFQRMKGQTVSLQPQEKTQSYEVERNTTDPSSADQASVARDSNAGTDEPAAPQRLPRPVVPPPCAPTQTKVVRVSSSSGKKCAFWPVCKLSCDECGGHSRDKCKIYGVNGSKSAEAPSESEVNHQRRLCNWKPEVVQQNCVWHPWCKSTAAECGGIRFTICKKFGSNGTDREQAPSREEVVAYKKRVKAQKERERYAAKKASNAKK